MKRQRNKITAKQEAQKDFDRIKNRSQTNNSKNKLHMPMEGFNLLCLPSERLDETESQ